MTVRTRDNKVTKVLVMMDRVLRGIKGDDQGAEDRKEVEPKVLTNQLVTVAGDMSPQGTCGCSPFFGTVSEGLHLTIFIHTSRDKHSGYVVTARNVYDQLNFLGRLPHR